MERAHRLAENPLRQILEAAKFRRKPGDVEPAAAPHADTASSAAATRSAARTGAARPPGRVSGEPTTAPAVSREATPTPVAAAAPPAVAAPATAVEAPPPQAPPPAPAVVVQGATTDLPPAAAPPVAAAPPATVPSPATASPRSTASAGLPRTAAVEPSRLKLVSKVDPEFPPLEYSDVGRFGKVDVDFSIRADGAVDAVTIVSPVPARLERYLLPAFQQWRFEPVAPGVHRVRVLISQ